MPFSDLNDDGNSDVRMTFEIGGDITVFAWLWDDKNDASVFSEALLSFCDRISHCRHHSLNIP